MYSNRTNYHSHCDFCDGRAPMEAFVQAAIAAGYTSYGISSHSPIPIRNQCNMPYEKMPAYIAEFQRLRRLYGDRIDLYLGLEIDYCDEEHNPSSAYYQELPLDYRIGSVHYVPTPAGIPVDTDGSAERFVGYVDEFFDGDVEEVVRRFYRQTERMIAAGGFDMIGHIDKIGLNASAYAPGFDRRPDYVKRVQTLLESLEDSDLLVEVNTKALTEKKRLFPAPEYFPLMKRLGLRVVVNSDTHYPDRIEWGRPETLKLLYESGFRTVWQMKAGKWAEVPIA